MGTKNDSKVGLDSAVAGEYTRQGIVAIIIFIFLNYEELD